MDATATLRRVGGADAEATPQRCVGGYEVIVAGIPLVDKLTKVEVTSCKHLFALLPRRYTAGRINIQSMCKPHCLVEGQDAQALTCLPPLPQPRPAMQDAAGAKTNGKQAKEKKNLQNY